MSKVAIQYFDISKKTKVSEKVFEIECEYDDFVPDCIFRVCSRCKKSKHVDHFGTNAYTGKPRKICNTCVEYNKEYRLKTK
jgi:hypothetical protein